MALLSSIKLNIAKKIEEDKEYRKRFFRGQAEDEIAISIKGLREKRKKRQIDLANEAGMKQSAVSRIEQSDYCGWSLKTLFRIADALDARLRVIFEPSEAVIEQYKKMESEIDQDEFCAELHDSSAILDLQNEEEQQETAAHRQWPTDLSANSAL